MNDGENYHVTSFAVIPSSKVIPGNEDQSTKGRETYLCWHQ